MDKQSSQVQTCVNYGCKKAYNIGPNIYIYIIIYLEEEEEESKKRIN
jgi:hypothetical protein